MKHKSSFTGKQKRRGKDQDQLLWETKQRVASAVGLKRLRRSAMTWGQWGMVHRGTAGTVRDSETQGFGEQRTNHFPLGKSTSTLVSLVPDLSTCPPL